MTEPDVSRDRKHAESASPSLLLVDDEDSFRDTVAQRLEMRGLPPRTAASGEECLERMDEDPAEVVVLDVRLPGMDGLEVLQRLKVDHPQTEVILVTGQATTTRDGVRGMKAGAFDYLSKPVEIDQLVRKIGQAHDTVVRRRERAREAAFREQMAQRMAEAQRLASLGTLASGVAHEINNPLAVINDAAGLIKTLAAKLDDPENPPSRALMEKAAEKIEKSVRRARSITHQLLGYSRAKDSAVRKVAPREVVDDVLELLGKEARNRDIQVKVCVHDAPPQVETDPDQLRQVLVNLISNAIQAMESDGTIEVSIREGDDSVVLEVRDQGPGIPPDVLEHIFEPFYSTKPAGKGTGLGLFVSRGIAEKLGGSLEVESALGRGAAFTLTLPLEFRGFTNGEEARTG